MVWTPTPAPRALSVLQTEVGNYILAPVDTTLASVITDALNDGVRKLNSRSRWPWTMVSENISLVASTVAYELATGSASKIRSVHLLNASDLEVSTLGWLDPKTFSDTYPDRSSAGSPDTYTAFNLIADGKIDFNVPPSAAFIVTYPKVKVRMFRRLILYSAAGDTLTTLGGATSDVENFIVWHAKAYMASISDQSKAAFALARAEETWRQLINESNREVDWER